MKWEIRKVTNEWGKCWGIFLQQKFCKTEEPVCYAVSRNKADAEARVEQLNNPGPSENT